MAKILEDYLYYEEKDPDLRIYHGDCLEIMPLLPKVDLVVTDPPYGIGIANNPFRQKHEKSDWDDNPCDQSTLKMIMEISDHQIIWGGNYFGLPASQGFLIWDKLQPQDFSSSMCEMAWISKQQPAKIFRKSVTSYAKNHPTQKPIEIMRWCLGFYEGSVLDPFLGSGTTLVACKELNRNGIGIEISEKYCEIAKKRLRATCKPLFTDVSGVKKNTKGNETQNATLFGAA